MISAPTAPTITMPPTSRASHTTNVHPPDLVFAAADAASPPATSGRAARHGFFLSDVVPGRSFLGLPLPSAARTARVSTLAYADGEVANHRSCIDLCTYHRQMAKSLEALALPGVAAAALFRGLADRTRLAILCEVTGGERRVTDLSARLGLAQSTVSTHLSCLRDCGLVTGRPQGRQVFYRLAVPELLELFRAAEMVLDRTGSAAQLCPQYGDHEELT